MAQRTKTVEYVLPTHTGVLAAATRLDLTAITLYLPENTSRTFKSVILEVTCRDAVTVATTMTAPLLGIKLGAAAFSDATLSNPPANSGESAHYFFHRDVTSYFTTNFGAGTSQTAQVGVQFAAATTTNITAKLIITYEFNDAAQTTRVKTVKIPLESPAGALTTTLTEYGAVNQVPLLDTFCPEASKTFRQIWFELQYNEALTGTTTDVALQMALDAEGAHNTGNHESGLASSCSGKYHWVRRYHDSAGTQQEPSGAFTTSAVHAFKLATSLVTAGATFNHVAIIMHVTYEYNHDTSTSILNSVEIPLSLGGHSRNSATEFLNLMSTIFVQEPATLALVQSGVLIMGSNVGNVNPIVKVGSQTSRTYTESGGLFCGATFLTHRFDSGATGGAGHTLTLGKNVLNVQIASSGTLSGYTAIAYLNYTSGKAATGAETHNRTIQWFVQAPVAVVAGNAFTLPAFNFAETAYFINQLGLIWNGMYTAAANQASELMLESASGEIGNAGYLPFFGTQFSTDTEMGWFPLAVNLTELMDVFDRWAGDPDSTRWDIKTARSGWSRSLGTQTHQLKAMLVMHNQTFAFAGNITNSNGGTVNIAIYSPTLGKIGSTSRVGNGAYSATVYDRSESLFAEAYEDGTYKGRSDNAVAV